MYLYAVSGSKSAKIVALFTLLAVIITLLPVSAFAEDEAPANVAAPQCETGFTGDYPNCIEIPPVDLCTDDSALNFNEVGKCAYSTQEEANEACEIEGHKYDAKGDPLEGWYIGLKKFAMYGEVENQYTILNDTTDEQGYYCLEWDNVDFSEVEPGYESFFYRIFEKLQDGWKFLSIEEGADYESLSEVPEDDIWYGDDEVGTQFGESNGYIIANAEHHVDFYNTEIDPCDEDTEVTDTLSRVVDEDPCDNSDTYTIDGYKFNDKNGNGIWDTETEDGIEGWEIVLTQGDADPQYDTTDENGYYSFEVEEGSYAVSETQQKGWEQTAILGENVDGDTCYINVGEVVYTKSDVIGDSAVIEYDNTCTFGNQQTIVTPVCETGDNLLVNGSFEDPEVEGDWNIFETVAGWTIALSDGLELWANGFYGGASEGNQNAELDGNAPTKITQNVTTVPGATYELRFDFSARPDADSIADNNVDGLVDGLAIMNATANGSDITENTWSTYSETFVATNASTEIGFEDKGTANSYGSLIDNAVLCLLDTPDEGGDDDDTPSRSSSGTRVKRAPAGEVLGAQATTPTGMVLGEATSTLPVGAPNTGAGGTAPVSVSLPTMVAILGHSARKSK